MWPDGENQEDINDEVGLRLPSGIHCRRPAMLEFSSYSLLVDELLALVHTADILIPQDQEESSGGKAFSLWLFSGTQCF